MKTTFENPVVINHNGKAIYFVNKPEGVNEFNEPISDSYHYNILNLKVESDNDDLDWDGYTRLEFPSHVSLAGMNMIRVEKPVVSKGIFEVMTDQKYIYVCRSSSEAVYVNRYQMVEVPNPQISGQSMFELQPAWELRYQRSGRPDTPLNDKDTQSYMDLEGEPFIEPAYELPLGYLRNTHNYDTSFFSANFMPSNTNGVLRWQFFIAQLDTGSLLGYSIERTENGWFNFSKDQISFADSIIEPDQIFDLTMGEGGGIKNLSVVGPPSGTVYTKQEPILTADSDVLKLQQAYRLMLATEVKDLADPESTSSLSILDFAISRDGILANPKLTGSKLEVGEIKPAEYTLQFDGVSHVQILGDPIDLGASYTQQVWVNSKVTDLKDHLIMGASDSNVPDKDLPPSIWITDKFKIKLGFGDGTEFLSVSTKENVIQTNSWNNVIAVYKDGLYKLWVNGAQVPLRSHNFGTKKSATPLNGIGGQNGSLANMIGDLDEVRVWTGAQQKLALEYLYKEIPEEVAKEMADLQGYWRLDEGTGTQIKNRSSKKNRVGHLYGPQWIPATAPLEANVAPKEYVDPNGISMYAGVIIPGSNGHTKFGSIKTKSRPQLLSSADGFLHLYYQDANDEFVVAQYDTSNARAHYGVPWTSFATDSDLNQEGSLVFSTRQTGTIMNKAKVSFAKSSQPGLVDIKLDDGKGSEEIWSGLPNDISYITQVLEGKSVNQPGDAGLIIGEKFFFDYSKERRCSFKQVGEPSQNGCLQFVSRNTEKFIFSSIDITPDVGRNDEVGATCSAKLKIDYTDKIADGSFFKTLKNVPTDVDAFMQTINGSSLTYDYSDPKNTNPGEAKAYEIPSGNDTLMVVISDSKVGGMTIKVEDQSKYPEECQVTITLKMTNNADPISATWKKVPRESTGFVKAIEKGTEGKQPEIAAILNFFDISGKATVYNNLIDKEANLYAFCSFLDVFGLNQNGNVTKFESKLEKLQGRNEGKNNPIGSPGSLYFAVSSTPYTDNGFPATIKFSQENKVEAIMLQPGQDGGWFAESPRNCIEIVHGKSGIEVPEDPILNKPLIMDGNMTMESWVNIKKLDQTENMDDIIYPRVLQANLDENPTGSKYLLGTAYSSSLQFLRGDDLGPAAINVNDNDIEDEANYLINSNNYTVQLYLKANSKTAADAPGRIYEIVPQTEGFPGQRVTVSSKGEIAFDIIENGVPVAHKLNSVLKQESNWTMLTFSRQGNKISSYFNETPDISIPIKGDLSNPIHHGLIIGENDQARSLEMEMNQFAIWHRSFTPEEVKSRYNSAIPDDDEALVLLWRMDAFRNDKQVENSALRTQNLFEAEVTGYSLWEFPGVFSRAYGAVRNTAVMTRDALIANGSWNHLSSTYTVHHGIDLSGQTFGDCGNESNLNVNDAISVEAFVNLQTLTPGSNQVIFSKYGKETTDQCYELGIDGNNYPYLKVRLDGVTDANGKDVPENVLYRTIKSAQALKRDMPYYIVAVFQLTTTAEGPDDDKKNVTNLTGTIYVNASPSGLLTPDKLYGSVALNQSGTNANIGRTKPEAKSIEQGYFQGQISDLRLWNRAIDRKVISANYRNLSDKVIGEGLVSEWKFDDQQGRVAYDTKSENNALLTSSDLWITYYDNANIQLLLNGETVPLVRIDTSEVGGYQSKQMNFGSMKNNAGAFVNPLIGQIDEIRIWSEARTLEQITDNMERYLPANEDNLAGYWRFDVGSGILIADQTGNGNTGILKANELENVPVWAPSKAPINNEAKVVLNALGGLTTNFLAKIGSGPAVVEYPDSQFDANGELFSVFKRAYIYKDEKGGIQRVTGYKVGDLTQIYLGQIQTKPSIIGFVEGAPPLPSENLTRPYYTDPTAYTDYGGIASVELSDAKNTSIALSSTKENGNHLAFGIKGGFAINGKFRIPIIGTEVVDSEFQIGPAFELQWGTSETTGSGASYGISKSSSNSISNGGNWDAIDSTITQSSGERRYIPSNNGYALVRSSTADMYVQYLKSTGTMVGFNVVPNLDIPPDINIITFPINTAYTKNGTLDGKVGLLPDSDPAYQNADLKRGSYFKPIEAYSLKKKVERKEQELLTYYSQFNAVKRGKAQQNDITSEVDNNPIYDLDNNQTRTDLVNTYVWTSARGLYAESEGATSVRQETHSGTYNFEWSLGFETQGKLLVGSGALTGLYFEANLMGGTQWTVNVQKEKTEEDAFELKVEAAADGFLRKYNGDADDPGFSDNLIAGKVEAYRFMSYYLSPEQNNFDDFFSKVVDPVWYATSSDQRAAALREAEANPNPAWRIMHRVTYVSRIPPEFQAFPLDSQAPETAVPDNISGNKFLIDLIISELKDKDRTPLIIGETVRHVILEDLQETIPWWKDFLKAAKEENSYEQVTLSSLISDAIQYMIQYFETLDVAQ